MIKQIDHMLISVFQIIQRHILYYKWITQTFLKNYSNQYLIIKRLSKIILIKNDKDLLHEIGYSERDIICLNLEFKNFLIEQH